MFKEYISQTMNKGLFAEAIDRVNLGKSVGYLYKI